MPDISITYLQQTIFLSLVYNFVGLLCMWLGLSFINIINMNIYRALRKPLIQNYSFLIGKTVPVQINVQNFEIDTLEN